MILGIGTDCVTIHRMEKIYHRHGEQFLQRFFTPEEQHYIRQHKEPWRSMAKRFAGKEACVKALGTGFWQHGVTWTDFNIQRLDLGTPVVSLSGAASDLVQQKCPQGRSYQWHLSLCDEKDLALAFAVLSCI